MSWFVTGTRSNSHTVAGGASVPTFRVRCGEGSGGGTILSRGFFGKPNALIGSPTWISQDGSGPGDCGVVITGSACGGRRCLRHRAFDDDAVRDIAPQGDEQLAREGDDQRLLLPAVGLDDAFMEPAAQRCIGLMS